jgi:hypothetical protein
MVLKYLKNGSFGHLAKVIEERINAVTGLMNFLDYINSIVTRDWLLKSNDEMKDRMLHGSSKMSASYFFQGVLNFIRGGSCHAKNQNEAVLDIRKFIREVDFPIERIKEKIINDIPINPVTKINKKGKSSKT